MDIFVEKSVRLFRYIEALVELSSANVKSYERYEKTLWLDHLRVGDHCEAPVLGDVSEEGFLFRFSLPNIPIKPNPPNALARWLDTDRKDLALKSEITGKLGRVLRLEDFPEIPTAFEVFIQQSEDYKKAYAEWMTARQAYYELFLLHQKREEEEDMQLVCGVGLLQWKDICRPLITLEVDLRLDAKTSTFTLVPSGRAATVSVETDMVKEAVRSGCKLSEYKDFIETVGTDICNRKTIGAFLTEWIRNLHADGTYSDENAFKRTVSKTPTISFTPGLFLREGSVSGFLQCVNKMEDFVQTTEKVRQSLKTLEIFLEILENRDPKKNDTTAHIAKFREQEIYFPKPSNEEQRHIVRKLEISDCVVVQGPPGTGKSHTIANLICHFLAKGKRILVTAKTERALKVLQNLLPETFRQLCVSIIGDDRAAFNALAANITHLINERDYFNPTLSEKKIDEIASKLYELRSEEAILTRKLRDGTESETQTYHINEHYFGTPTDIVRSVQNDRELYGWLEEDRKPIKNFEAFKQNLSEYLEDFRYFTKEKTAVAENVSYCSEVVKNPQFRPSEMLPNPEAFRTWVDFNHDCTSERCRNADATLSILKIFSKKVLPTDAAWLTEFADAFEMHLSGDYKAKYEALEACIRAFEEHLSALQRLRFPENVSLEMLSEDAACLEQHLTDGGSLGFSWFRPKLVQRRLYLLKAVTINDRNLEEAEDFRKLGTLLKLKKDVHKTLVEFKQKTDGTDGEQLEILRHIRELLKLILKLNGTDEVFGFFEKKSLRDILLCSREDFEAWEKREAQSAVRLKEEIARLNTFAENLNENDTLGQHLTDAFRDKNIAHYALYYVRMDELYKTTEEKIQKSQLIRRVFNAKLRHEKERLASFRKCREVLKRYIPKALDWLDVHRDDILYRERMEKLQRAYDWKQANDWVQAYLKGENSKLSQIRLCQIEAERSECLKDLAMLHAKDEFFKRLTDRHCRHMNAYALAVRRIGKGTGKLAQMWRKDAQQHLLECKEAVPAWIMPMDRVFETVAFETEENRKFDIVIVDEASQCGIEGIPLFGFGEKMVIIGDDKQISPSNVGIQEDNVERLRKEYLFDYQFSASFHPDNSLFDHAKLRFGKGMITLREHFRCMPEIIRFSNDLCYADTPLIPLRQFDQNRLPPLQSVFVEDGFREGDGQRIVNRPEAKAICDKICEICSDPAYTGKTVGVVVLQGSMQADYIYKILLERLPAKTLEERKIVCGNPYHFQGDERDVILLSMVAAPNERNGVLSKPEDERRFNVAASRARDQMILFHSLRLEDCSPNDLRYRLIAFFQEKLESEISNLKQSELEYHIFRDDRSLQKPPKPFDSWFEADVALELLRKRLHVFSQYPVGLKRIDLVVESGNQRLAIECDGDYWHGAEQYEADMERQRQLERCGWEFFRIRQSEFYADKTACLEPLWQLLRHRGMMQSILK